MLASKDTFIAPVNLVTILPRATAVPRVPLEWSTYDANGAVIRGGSRECQQNQTTCGSRKVAKSDQLPPGASRTRHTAYRTPRAPDRKGNGGAPGHAEDQLTRSQRLADLAHDLPAWPARVGRVRSALGRHQLRQLHVHHPPSEGLARSRPPTWSVTSSKSWARCLSPCCCDAGGARKPHRAEPTRPAPVGLLRCSISSILPSYRAP